MSAYVWKQAHSRRTAYILRQQEKQAQQEEADTLLENLHAGVEPLPFEALDGKCEQRLAVPRGCEGLLIGKKGENFKNIKERHNVSCKLEDGETGSQVVLRGNPVDVARARQELEYDTDSVEVPMHMKGWVCGKGNRHLKEIQELSGVAVLRLIVEGSDKQGGGRDGASEVQPPEGASQPGSAYFELKGRRESVANARLCLECHMSYFPCFTEMEEVEAQLDQKITAAQARIGRRLVSAGAGGEGGEREAPEEGARGGARGRNDRGRGRGRGETAPEAQEQSGNGRGVGGRGRGRGREDAVHDTEELSTRGRGRSSKGSGRGRGRGRGLPGSDVAQLNAFKKGSSQNKPHQEGT